MIAYIFTSKEYGQPAGHVSNIDPVEDQLNARATLCFLGKVLQLLVIFSRRI